MTSESQTAKVVDLDILKLWVTHHFALFITRLFSSEAILLHFHSVQSDFFPPKQWWREHFSKNHLNHPHPLARGEPPAPKNHVKRAGIVNPPTNSTPWLRLLLRLIRSLRSRILRSSSKREPPATSAKGSCARGNSDERLRTRRQGGRI